MRYFTALILISLVQLSPRGHAREWSPIKGEYKTSGGITFHPGCHKITDKYLKRSLTDVQRNDVYEMIDSDLSDVITQCEHRHPELKQYLDQLRGIFPNTMFACATKNSAIKNGLRFLNAPTSSRAYLRAFSQPWERRGIEKIKSPLWKEEMALITAVGRPFGYFISSVAKQSRQFSKIRNHSVVEEIFHELLHSTDANYFHQKNTAFLNNYIHGWIPGIEEYRTMTGDWKSSLDKLDEQELYTIHDRLAKVYNSQEIQAPSTPSGSDVCKLNTILDDRIFVVTSLCLDNTSRFFPNGAEAALRKRMLDCPDSCITLFTGEITNTTEKGTIPSKGLPRKAAEALCTRIRDGK